MRNAWTHKIQWSGPTVHSSTVEALREDISTPVENFDAGSLAYWLGKFVQEVVNKDGQRYPGRTLYSLITGIKRFLAEKNVLLNPLDKLDDR